MVTSFWVVRSDGDPVAKPRARLFFSKDGEHHDLESVGALNGEIEFEPTQGSILLLLIVDPGDGHWKTIVRNPKPSQTIVCHPLPLPRESRWWIDTVGLKSGNVQAGCGIRLGVVDCSFSPHGGISHVQVKDIEGAPFCRLPFAGFPHGELIARILGQRPGPDNLPSGIAPGAELVCIGAETTDVGFEALDPFATASAIFTLAQREKVDLISLSAGRFGHPFRVLREAIIAASELGVLTIVAAGNTEREEASSMPGVAYPARYPEVLSVGAVGLLDWGPPETEARWESDVAKSKSDRVGYARNPSGLFHWRFSAFGNGLDSVGPGVGIVVYREGKAPMAVTGTSFSAPIVCGLLAVELSRDSVYNGLHRNSLRTSYARSRLARLCVTTGLNAKYEGQGIPTSLGAHSGSV